MMNGNKNDRSNDALEGDLLGGHHYESVEEEKLERSLTNRHIQMIAIGGAIGTGLFMGSGKTLAVSGTSIILTYLIIGFFFFFVMRAMGELLLSNLPAWIPAFSSIAILTLLNFVAVKLFGEVEFWFALIKIIAIIMFLLVGVYLITIGFVSPDGVKASLAHVVEKESLFPYGLTGFLAGFQIAVFAFVGIDLSALNWSGQPRRKPKIRILLCRAQSTRFHCASCCSTSAHWCASSRLLPGRIFLQTRAHSLKCSR